MAELEYVSGGLRKQLDLDSKKRLSNNALAAPAADFSMFIDRALAETQVEGSKKDERDPKKLKPQLVEMEEDPEDKTTQKKTLWTVTPEITYQKETTKSKNKDTSTKSNLAPSGSQNLNAAVQLVEQRLAQIFSWDGRELKVNKVEGGALVSPRVASTIDELFQKLVAHMQKMKAGNLESLKISLQPEHLGEMDLYFTITEENGAKKIFLAFAGEEKALQLLKEKQQELSSQLQQNGYNLGGMEFILYGGQDHQRQDSPENKAQQEIFTENVLKSPDKEAIINTIDNYVADLIVNYIA